MRARPPPAPAASCRATFRGGLIYLDLPLDWTATCPEDVLDAAATLVKSCRTMEAPLSNSAALAVGRVILCQSGRLPFMHGYWWQAVRTRPMSANSAGTKISSHRA